MKRIAGSEVDLNYINTVAEHKGKEIETRMMVQLQCVDLLGNNI